MAASVVADEEILGEGPDVGDLPCFQCGLSEMDIAHADTSKKDWKGMCLSQALVGISGPFFSHRPF